MSDFAAVAESDRFPAKWAAGDAKENELVLSADFGEGTFLSGSVWERLPSQSWATPQHGDR